MVYSAIDVANYIVKKSIDLKKPISNLRLQKILYYLQARFLVETGQPLFSDEIGKWKYGPVTPSIYHEFKKYGSSTIDSVSGQLLVKRNKNGDIVDIGIKEFDKDDIDPQDRDKIDDTIEKLSLYGTFNLVEKTHKQALWSTYEDDILNNRTVAPYSNEEILEYFTNHHEDQIWTKKTEI